MTLEEDYKLAKRIDELLCTEYDKCHPENISKAMAELATYDYAAFTEAVLGDAMYRGDLTNIGRIILGSTEDYCLTMAEKKALREFGRFEELKRIYGEDE